MKRLKILPIEYPHYLYSVCNANDCLRYLDLPCRTCKYRHMGKSAYELPENLPFNEGPFASLPQEVIDIILHFAEYIYVKATRKCRVGKNRNGLMYHEHCFEGVTGFSFSEDDLVKLSFRNQISPLRGEI